MFEQSNYFLSQILHLTLQFLRKHIAPIVKKKKNNNKVFEKHLYLETPEHVTD